MLLSLLCFDGIGADDHNYIAAEEDVSFMPLPAETQDAVIEAVGEGVMFTPMAGRSLDCTPMPLSFVGGRTAEDADNARADGAKNYENCALDDGEILFCDRFVKEEGAMARMIAEQKALEERRRIEAERRRIEAERAAEQRRIADYKTHLQEVVQRKSNQHIAYELVNESGPDHNKLFEFEVRINGVPSGRGSGRTKKEAEQMAACKALEAMEK
jgi:hypothetical protein